jgi:hypothetical protein
MPPSAALPWSAVPVAVPPPHQASPPVVLVGVVVSGVVPTVVRRCASDVDLVAAVALFREGL